MKKEANFGTDSISKLLLQQSIPAALGILVLSIYSIVDTIFIGQYIGGVGIAAITIVSPITFLVSSIGLGIGMGGGSLISIKLGENDANSAKNIFGNQSLMILLFSILFIGGGFLFANSILGGFGAHGEVLTASHEYFFFTLIGLPFFMGQIVLNNVLRSEGKASQAMLILILPSILNIVLDAIFIIQLDMGLNGAAMATAISQASGVLLGVVLILKSSQIIPSLANFKFSGKLIRSISSLGSVQFFSQASMSIVIIIANNLLMKYGGDLAISAYGLDLRIMMFAFFPVIGIVQGFMPVAGYNFGARNIARVKEAIKKSFISSTLIGILIMTLMLFFLDPILEIFTTEKELLDMARVALFYFVIGFPLLGIQQVSTSYFQAIGKAKPALWLTLAKQFILIPTMFILPLWFGLDGIWYTIPITEVATTLIVMFFFVRDVKSITKN